MNRLALQVSVVSGVPIYRQLMEQVRTLVAGKRLRAGEFLPSVRAVAEELSINPMTVSKAYSLLERDGVVENIRGRGLRVKPMNGEVSKLELLEPAAKELVDIALRLALSREQVLGVLKPMLEVLGHARK
jgi:GntR family transcriptional regulator